MSTMESHSRKFLQGSRCRTKRAWRVAPGTLTTTTPYKRGWTVATSRYTINTMQSRPCGHREQRQEGENGNEKVCLDDVSMFAFGMQFPHKLTPLAAGAGAVALLALLYARAQERKRLHALGGAGGPAVGMASRHGVVARHGQRVELGFMEQGMIELAAFLRGSYRACVYIEIRGHGVTEAGVRAAVKAVQQWQPGFRSKAVSPTPGTILLEVDDTLELPVRFCSLGSCDSMDDAWMHVWRAENLEKVRYAVVSAASTLRDLNVFAAIQAESRLGEAMARVDVVRSSSFPDVAVVAWTVNHAVIDGVSFGAVLNEFMLQLASFDAATGRVTRKVSPQPWEVPVDVLVRPSSLLHQWQRAATLSTLKFPSGSKQLTPEFNSMVVDDMVASGVTARRPYVFSKEQSAALLARCRAHKTTLTGALLAAMSTACKAVRSSSSDGDTVFVVNVDMRRRVAPEVPRTKIGCLVSGMLVSEPAASAP